MAKHRYVFVMGMVVVLMAVMGCGTKTQPTQETTDTGSPYGEVQEPINNTVPSSVQPAVMPEIPATSTAVPAVAEQPVGAPSPSDLSLSPKNIQIALKNAGFYKGEADGIIGPKTKQAIKAFQAQNNLAVDGKVGSKTWEKLKTYLNAAAPSQTEQQSSVTVEH